MKRLPDEPARLLDLRPQDDPANVARLVRSAIRAPVDHVPKLKGRIRYSLRRRTAWRRRYLRVTLLGGVVFLAGGVMGAVVQPIFRRWQQQTVESVPNTNPARSAARSRFRRVSSPPSHVAVAENDLLSPVVLAESPSLLASAPNPAPPVSVAPPAVPPAQLAARTMAPSLRIAPAVARPSPARAAVAAPAPVAAAPFASPTAGPNPTLAASDREPVRLAVLVPPSLQPEPERWPSPTGSAAQGSAAPLVPLPSPLQSAAEDVPPAAAPPSISPSSTPAEAPPAGLAPKPLVPPPPSEQALLSRAVRSLRSEHRPGSALAVLDEYVAQFPSGSLLPEATRLRAEALLALGHKPAALAELNRELASVDTGGEESLLVRGELRAAAGRWRDAREDFDAVVRAYAATTGTAASPKMRERFERALWGRASARSHLGDEAGARADLRECLRRFPRGQFATQAARLLGELH